MHKKSDEVEKPKGEKQELVDEEGETLLDVNPMKKTCKECNIEVVTYVEHELSAVFYLFVLLSMFLFGWTFIFLLPFAYLLLQNVVHRCSQCLNEIGTRHMFGLPDFSQEILTLRLGKSMIVVVQKKIGIAIFAALTVIFLYFSWFYDFGALETQAPTESIEIAATWLDFHEE